MKKNYSRITATPGGEYIWVYDMNLFKETSQLITLIKVFALGSFTPVLLLLLLTLLDTNLSGMLEIIIGSFLKTVLFLILFILIGYYLIYIPLHGNHYMLIYAMTTKKITSMESAKNADKNALESEISMHIKDLSTSDSNDTHHSLAYTKNQLTITFKSVTKLIIYKNQHIKLIASDMTQTLICFKKEDSNFIETFLLEKCHHAKIIYK